MEADQPPPYKQVHLDKSSLWVDEPIDEPLSLLENALREDEPSISGGEHIEDVYSLLEENTLLRGSSAIGPHPQNAVHAS